MLEQKCWVVSKKQDLFLRYCNAVIVVGKRAKAQEDLDIYRTISGNYTVTEIPASFDFNDPDNVLF